MKQAYKDTIKDLKIELDNTEWWRFLKIARLHEEIGYYEELLNIIETNS